MNDLPAQTHSDTSMMSARMVSRLRSNAQERWVYEALRAEPKADFEMWALVQGYTLFDKLSSLHRARLGLIWLSRARGATPYHPVEKSGQRHFDHSSNRMCMVWQLKPWARVLTYELWAENFKIKIPSRKL